MARRSKNVEPQPYDFRRPIKLSREHVRTLQICYETFARQYTTLLTSSLRVVSQITLVSIQQLTYDEYISSLMSPTILVSMSLDPMPGTGILELSLGAGMATIDHLLGGAGGEQPQRPLTDIEAPLLRGQLTRVLDELRYAFEPHVIVTPKLTGIEYNPQFVQACSAGDAVIVASFEMRVGEEDCLATVCLPFASVFPSLNDDGRDTELTANQRRAREIAHRNVVAALGTAPIDVSIRFEPVRMRSEEIVGLRIGDVVQLNHPVDRALTVCAADLTFAHAVPGNQGHRLACLVVPSPDQDQEEYKS